MRRSLVGMATVGLLLSSAAPTSASCIMPPTLEEALTTAKVAFVGTVISPQAGERSGVLHSGGLKVSKRVIVRVEEVWRGPRLPSEIEVFGGGANPRVMTSNDRTFTLGVRYLFVLDHHYPLQPGMPGVAGDPAATLIPPPTGPPRSAPFNVGICNLIEPYTAEELDRYRPADAISYPAEPTSNQPDAESGPPWSWIGVTLGIAGLSVLSGWAWGRRRWS